MPDYILPQFDPGSDAGPVPSPCISVCVMDGASGLCRGCARTIDEIAVWSTASEAQKRAVWQAIVERRIIFKEK